MREQYPRITELGGEVVAVAPCDAAELRAFAGRFSLPFPCLPDPRREAFRRYGVGSAFWSLGQRPAVFVIGPEGELRAEWRGRQQWEIPTVDEIIEALR